MKTKLTVGYIKRWLNKLELLESQGAKIVYVGHLLRKCKHQTSIELIKGMIEMVDNGLILHGVTHGDAEMKGGWISYEDLMQELQRSLDELKGEK